MKEYIVKVDKNTIIEDDSYIFVMFNVELNGKKVGTFQEVFGEGVVEEDVDLITAVLQKNVNDYMDQTRLEDVEPLLQILHEHLMTSSNLCLYGDDMESWLPDDLDKTWEEILVELKALVETNKYLEDLITFGEYQFIVWGNFMSAFNLHTIEINWESVAWNLLSLAETLEYFGDYEDGLRGRLRKECELSEAQLDKLGV